MVGDPKSHIPLLALLSTTVFTMGILVIAVRNKLAAEEAKKEQKSSSESPMPLIDDMGGTGGIREHQDEPKSKSASKRQ